MQGERKRKRKRRGSKSKSGADSIDRPYRLAARLRGQVALSARPSGGLVGQVQSALAPAFRPLLSAFRVGQSGAGWVSRAHCIASHRIASHGARYFDTNDQ